MDFNDLMEVASSKHQLTQHKSKNKKTKAGSEGVSGDAVKAFLARKDAEKVKQKAEEEAARRARIKARIEREEKEKSKNVKNKDKPTASAQSHDSPNQERASGNVQSASASAPVSLKSRFAGEKSRVAHARKFSAEPSKPLSVENTTGQGSKNMGAKQNEVVKNTKADKAAGSKDKLKSKHEKVVTRPKEGHKQKTDETKSIDNHEGHPEPPASGSSTPNTKPVAKKRKPRASAPLLSFQELMTVAKQQLDNPDAAKELLAAKRSKIRPKADLREKSRTKDIEVEIRQKDDLKEKSRTNNKHINHDKRSKEPAESKKVTTPQRSTPTLKDAKDVPKGTVGSEKSVKGRNAHANVSRITDTLKNSKGTPSSSAHGKQRNSAGVPKVDRRFPDVPKVETGGIPKASRKFPDNVQKVDRRFPEKPKQMKIERETVSEKRREMMTSGKRSGAPSHARKRYHVEEEMDDFIDDSDESSPDVSSYIKDIFGYDRSRYRDSEDDEDNMVSSFADIQREEAKSTRIAKLEDELEKLKESYEQQRPNKKSRLKH